MNEARPDASQPDPSQPDPSEPDPSQPDQISQPETGTVSTANTGRHRRHRIAASSLVLAVVLLVLDQLSKHWAVSTLDAGNPEHVVWTLQWNLAYNTGMAFSQGRSLGPVIAIAAVGVVVVLVASIARTDRRSARLAAGLLIGGALGNLTDRMFRGEAWLRGGVVDFIDVQWWPIFNVADMGVSIGAVLLAASMVMARGAS